MSSLFGRGLDFFKEVTELNRNVKELQRQMDRVLDRLEKQKTEVSDLRNNVRILEERIKASAMLMEERVKTVAMETVLNATVQMTERILKMEQQGKVSDCHRNVGRLEARGE